MHISYYTGEPGGCHDYISKQTVLKRGGKCRQTHYKEPSIRKQDVKCLSRRSRTLTEYSSHVLWPRSCCVTDLAYVGARGRGGFWSLYVFSSPDSGDLVLGVNYITRTRARNTRALRTFPLRGNVSCACALRTPVLRQNVKMCCQNTRLLSAGARLRACKAASSRMNELI